MASRRPAGFWIRAGALAIDVIVFVLVQRSLILVARVMQGVSAADSWSVRSLVGCFTVLFTGAYTTALHAGFGQTLGKLLVGIRVVGLEADELTVGQALLRWLAYAVSLGTLGLGFLMAALRRDKRALHDLIAGTRVVHLEPEPVEPAPPPERPVEVASDAE